MRNLKSFLVVFFVVVAVAIGHEVTRHSSALGQDSYASQTDINLQRRQVRALERIATELATANRWSRRCR